MYVKFRTAYGLLATASVLALGMSGSAYGEAAPAEKNTAGVGEIVVTAEKREANLQDVPVAISAYTSDKRDQIGIDSVQDMTNFTPGFIYNSGNDRVSVRGIGRYTNQLGADSSVGVYEDGAFETFTVKAGNDSIFVDRIEVLRGPQGTLYGRNSIGGAVNIISRQPTKDWYAEIRGSYDNYNQHIEEGAISGPLNDNLRFRLAASKTDQSDGWFKNLAAGGKSSGNVRDEWYGEAQLQGEFSEKFDFWLKGFGGEWSNGGGNAGGRVSNQVIVAADGKTVIPGATYASLNAPGLTPATYLANTFPGGITTANNFGEAGDPLVPGLGIGFAFPNSSFNPTGVNPGNANIRNFYSNPAGLGGPNEQQFVKLRDYYGAVLKLNYHFDGMDLKYVGQAQHYAYVTHEEWGDGGQLATGLVSFTPAPGFAPVFPNSMLYYGEEHWFSTQEINLISTGTGPFQWVTGLYNFNEKYKQPEEIAMPGQVQLSAPLGKPANPNRDVVYQEGDMGAETFAGFGQIDWKFTDTLKTTLGLRYSYDSKYGKDHVRLLDYIAGAGFAIDVTAPFLPLGGVAQTGASASVIDPATGIATRKLKANWSDVTGTAGLQWDPDPDTNVYVKYSRGYKSGGFNSGFGNAANPRTNPENSNDYQLGVKKNFGRALQINLDVFYDQYYNAQIPISVVQPSGLLSALFYNLPEARSDGIELESIWSPINNLQFIFNYGYNDTSIIKSGSIVDAGNDTCAIFVGAQPTPGSPICGGAVTSRGQTLNGNQLPNAPKNKLAFNANYTFDFQPGSLSFSASYIWRDVQFGSIFNRPFNSSPSWDQVDLRAEFKSSNNHYSIIAYGKNVMDTTGYVAGAGGAREPSGEYVIGYALTPPAVYGVELQYRF